MANDSVEGGCLCGAIRYRVSGRPTNTMVCHCRSCRRAAASPVVAWVTFALADFRLLRGEPAEFRSSAPVRRSFCAKCGTPLTYTRDDAPTTVDITTCSLDDPAAFPPTHHSWLSHDLAWVKFGDGLPAFAEWRNDKSV
jgi:hypothetical protein